MSTEQEPTAGPETAESTEQYDAHVDARALHKNVERAEAAIMAAKLKGDDLKAAYTLLEAYKTGNVTEGTLVAAARLAELAAETGPVQSVLQAIYSMDAKLTMLNPRMRQVAATAKKEWSDEMLIAELDKKHDGLMNAAARGASNMATSAPGSSIALMPFKLMRTAYRGARTAAGVVPGLEQSPEHLTLEELQYLIFCGAIPASDAVVEHAMSKLPSESGVRAFLAKGFSYAALLQPEAAVLGAGMKAQDTAEMAKVRALLAVRAQRMEAAANENYVVDLTKVYEENEMHAAGEQTDEERKAA